MNCQEEEDNLDDSIKKLSDPSPNFDLPDLKELFDMCVVKPHIYQGNVWLLMFHPEIVALLLEHDVLYQAYNVMNGILFEGDANQRRKTRAPNAMRQLEMISTGMEKSMPNVLLAFLVQHHVAAIHSVVIDSNHRRKTYASRMMLDYCHVLVHIRMPDFMLNILKT